MTVPVTPVDQDILHILQQNTPQIPYQEITHIIHGAHLPGRFGNIHTGRWKDQEVEIREPFGEPATVEREVKLLYRLRQCPQILTLHGFTIEPSTQIPFLVLHQNEHGTLHSYLQNFHPHLTWPDRYNLALDIALGLRYLHHKGYRHRHLHSASILIDTNGSAVLSDFGASRDSEVISSREHPTRMGYLAPERVARTPARYSIECDIYALGVVFWEISSGRPPFEEYLSSPNLNSAAMVQLAQAIMSGRRENPVEGTDPIFEDLYTRCWHPNPQERPSIEWVIKTLSVLLKQPSGAILRQIEELSLDDAPRKPAYSAKINYQQPQHSSPAPVMRSMPIKVGRSPSADQSRESQMISAHQFRSREILISPREPDYPPPPPPGHHGYQGHQGPPPVPPINQRRKMSTVSSIAPSMRSMSISSGSSSGSSSGPSIPARDSRRVSTLSSVGSLEIPKYDLAPKRRTPQTIWEACQEGNIDRAEWFILSNESSPDGFVSLPQYSMLAEVAPIHVACFYQPENLLAMLKMLKGHGANLALLTTLTHQSALHIVLEHATSYELALEVSRFLILECRLGVNDQDNRGLTPFHKYLKNPHLSARTSVAGSELYVLLRERGQANLNLESIHEGNALGLTARYLRVDLMRLFLLTDILCSDVRSLSFAINAVEAPLSESRSSRVAQEQCRAILAEWAGERGEDKRIQMAQRILDHQGVSTTSSVPSAPGLTPKNRKQSIGILGLGKAKKNKEEPAPPVPKALTEVEVAQRIMQSGVVRQRQLKNFMSNSGF